MVAIPVVASSSASSQLIDEELRQLLRASVEDWSQDLLGSPTLRTPTQLRWGRNGSLSIVTDGPKAGLWFDHEAAQGGDALDLIAREIGGGTRAAAAWARSALGLGGAAPRVIRPRRLLRATNSNARPAHWPTATPLWLQVWQRGQPILGTPAETYLGERPSPEWREANYLVSSRGIPREWLERLAAADLARYIPREGRRPHGIAFKVTTEDGEQVAVQVVWLNEHGTDKAGGHLCNYTGPAKQSFGHLDDASIRLPGVGKLIYCEGPEDGLSMWAATGRPVAVTLGSMGKLVKRATDIAARHPAITLAADRDKPGSVAALQLHEAAEALAAAGVAVDIAMPPALWPGKVDWNAVHISRGLEAVTAGIAAAQPFGQTEEPAPAPAEADEFAELVPARHGLPAYYHAPTEAREAALARKAAVVEGFFAEALATSSAYGRRLVLTGCDASDDVSKAVVGIVESVSVWWLTPSLRAAEERAAAYRAGAGANSLPAYVVRGRQAQDPTNTKLQMCRRFDVANKAAEVGLSIREKVCPDCRFRESCGYLRQDREIAAMGGRGVFFANHAYAFLPACPAPAAKLVVADGSLVQAARGKRLILDPAKLDPENWSFGQLDERFPFRSVMIGVREALTGPDALETLRGAVKLRDITIAAGIFERAASREACGAVDAGGDDREIVDRLDGVERRDALKVAWLLRMVEREYDQPRATFNAIRFEPEFRFKSGGKDRCEPRILGFAANDLNVLREVPIINGDATGSAWFARKIFGEYVDHVHVGVERLGTVIGTTSKRYSARSILGANSRGEATRADEAERLRADIAKAADGAFVVASKGVLTALQDESGLQSTDCDHFGSRGGTPGAGRDTILVIGRDQPSTTSIEDDARPFLADEHEPLLRADAYVIQTRGRRMRDGTVKTLQVEVHPDPRVQSYLELIRESAIANAIGFERARITLLNELAVDVTYDLCRRHAKLLAGGERWEIALESRGVLPLGDRDLHLGFPHLWGSRAAAAHDLKRGAKTQVESYYLESGPPFARVTYRVPRQTGGDSLALIDLSRHPDPGAALFQLLGVDVRVKCVEGRSPVPEPAVAVAPAPAPRPAVVSELLPARPIEGGPVRASEPWRWWSPPVDDPLVHGV